MTRLLRDALAREDAGRERKEAREKIVADRQSPKRIEASERMESECYKLSMKLTLLQKTLEHAGESIPEYAGEGTSASGSAPQTAGPQAAAASPPQEEEAG